MSNCRSASPVGSAARSATGQRQRCAPSGSPALSAPIRTSGRAAASARWNTNHAGLWRDLRDRVARARPGHDGRSDMIGERGWRLLAPVLIGALFLALWEAIVRLRDIPPYILPAPSAVAMSL